MTTTARKWKDFPELADWLASMAHGMTEVIGSRVSDLFTDAGQDGIKSLCKKLDGNVLYMPMVVTPDMAQLFMSLQTEHQRNSNDLTVDGYKRDMAGNKWMETGEGLTFNDRGEMVNGGHRCRSIVASGKPVRTLVVFGIKPEAAIVIDSGRMRTAANTLTFAGERYTQELGSIIPRLIAAEQGRWIGPARYTKPTREELLGYLDAHPELRDIAVEAKRCTGGPSRIPRCTTVAAGIAMATLGRLPARLQPEVSVFFEQLTTGAGLTNGSSVLALRNALMKGAPPQWRRSPRRGEPGGFTVDETLALIFSAWNRRHETNVRTVRVPAPLNEESFPHPKPLGFMHD